MMLEQLLREVRAGKRDRATLSALGECLRQITFQAERVEGTRFEAISGGKSLDRLATALLNAANPDMIDSAARFLAASEGGSCCSGEEPPDPTPEQIERMREQMVTEACTPFDNAALCDSLQAAATSGGVCG